jgi:spoIIIJ-associated protein
MEWVETTSKTIEEAKDTLLDRLGVDEAEAEFEILEEPKVGLFGRTRGDARVRARVRPKTPRPKDDRRRNNRSSRGRGRGSGGNGEQGHGSSDSNRSGGREPKKGDAEVDNSTQNGPQERRPARSAPRAEAPAEIADPNEIATAVESFLQGLVTTFGVEASVATVIEDGQIEARIDGTSLGYLIGPKGGVIDAIQELARTFSQKEAKGKQAPRLRVDVGEYRVNRKLQLEQFVREIGEKAVASGESYAFEPMGSVDRKTVHDTAASIDGLASRSEGEDPRRKVVILPE